MEGLFAKAVAGDEQSLRRRIPDREGKHAVEVLDTRLAPLLVGREDYLSIAGRLEVVTVAGSSVRSSR